MPASKLRKIAIAYIVLQAIIWVKCAAFFSLYGYGQIMPFNAHAFTKAAWLFDYVFHEGMHAGIGILALLFGKNMQRLEKRKLLAIIFVAVALHNVGYWLTRGHPSIAYSLLDIVRDVAILFAFVVAGHALERFGVWKKLFSAFLPGQKI